MKPSECPEFLECHKIVALRSRDWVLDTDYRKVVLDTCAKCDKDKESVSK